MYTDQACVPKEFCPFKILSINRVHEVSGHFFSSVVDKNVSRYAFLGVEYIMAEYLYLHIPFCVRKCIYCDFLSVPYDESLVIPYTAALCKELELKKHLAGTLKTVFIGGGTPSTLPETCFSQIFSCIRENYTLSSAAEVTVEANPGAITKAKVAALLSLGVNRVSLGIQSFQDRELKTLGRIHTADEAISSAEMLRSAGIENFSFDLIYGIPGQGIETWNNSLSRAVSLNPKHISAYELTPEKGTVLNTLLESGILSLPGEDPVLDMYDLGIDYLESAGFGHYEISNYALPGFHCIHNLNYWNRGEYLAAGAGAHSFLRGFRAMNTADINEYVEKLGSEIIPEIESVEISGDEALREFIFLGLRKTEGIRLADADNLGLKLAEAADEMAREGMLQNDGSLVRLTRKGLPIANAVIIQLLGNLGL